MIELMRQRIGFDEMEFRSQLASLHASTQSAFKEQVDALYDLVDAHVSNLSESLLVTQRSVMQEAEELIGGIHEDVMEVEEMEHELDAFMKAVQMAYERTFPRLRGRE